MDHTTSRRGRRFAVPAIVLAALLALAGCSSAGDSGTSGSGAPATVPAAEGATQYPLTLRTWAGESVLEQRPARIAVIGFSPNLDALEALDVVPVYTMAEETQWPWRDQAWFSQIEFRDTVTRRDPINFEGIASTSPDLIVATNFVQDEAAFQRLATIAPVLENPTKVMGDQISWQDTQRMIGAALDLPGAADRAVAAAEQKMDETARANPQFAGKTITVATDYTQTGIDYYTVAGGTAEGVVRRMGFTSNPLARNFVAAPRVADEQVGQLDADVLMMFFTDAAARDARAAAPLFQALPPVAGKRYIAITTDEPGSEITWVLRRGASATSLPWAVDVIADRVTGAGLT